MDNVISDIDLWYSKAEERGLLKLLAKLVGPDFKARDVKKESYTGMDDLLYPRSVTKVGQDVLALLKMKSGTSLGIAGENKGHFKGTKKMAGSTTFFFCPLDHGNAVKMRKFLPNTAPSPLTEMDVTFGVGDRLGIATPGHIRLFEELNERTLKVRGLRCAPVFAQQSLREVDLCGRDFEDVLDSATWAVFQESFESPWGADGDHLKDVNLVRKTLKIGFTMITADVSDHIRGEFASLEAPEIVSIYERRIDRRRRRELENKYLRLSVSLDTGETVEISRPELARAVLIYDAAIDHARKLYLAGLKTHRHFDFELSIDETDTPTQPQAHVFISMEMTARGVELSTLAPRFEGEFQKGIDYIGDRKNFDATFRTHAAIARHFGYRLSVHSGSDKFTVFPSIGKHTNHRFHLKTAGTNWLQALLVISMKDPALFRTLYEAAKGLFAVAQRYYHITPNLENLPDLATLMDSQLPVVFQNTDARQVMHVTYGEMLRDRQLREKIYRSLYENIESYWESLVDHIGKHLKYLGLMK